MSQSLMTGVSGLRAYQQQLDVVANNLANLNTTGFKSQTTIFSDFMYNSRRSGSGAINDTFGGTNPQQVGTGVDIAQISRRFGQGTLQATGEELDFALQGNGFFMLADQSGERVFSRAGSFALDGRGNLVDPATGYLVQRVGDLGEPIGDEFGLQVPGDTRIHIPLGAPVPGARTTSIDFLGNLPSSALPPQSEVLVSSSSFETDTGPAQANSLISDLTINDTDYVAGDQIELAGTNPDGTPFSTQLNAENATMQDLLDALNGQLVGATAELTPNGTVTITADETGDAFTSLAISDALGNVGGTSWARNTMVVETEGKGGDTFEAQMEVFDVRGNDHGVRFSFEKQGINSWNVEAELIQDVGVVLDSQIFNLSFNEDGTYSLAGGPDDGDANIEIKFDTVEEAQVIEIDFSEMNHMATSFALSNQQDGAPPGALVSVSVTSSGRLDANASNGRVFPLAQLAIAKFANEEALNAEGGSYFTETSNSGSASIGTGLTSGRGQVIGNQLETSNVDIAQEFTQLIVAQRGFSANARTITVADEILEELTNIIR